MKLFFTSKCAHFSAYVKPDLIGKLTIKNFSDGELYVKIEENVYNEPVWVIASTLPPAQSLIELFFILDALEHSKACVHLLLVYCAYARQDRVEPGESFSSELFFKFLSQFCINKTVTVHIHNPQLGEFYDFQNVIPYSFFNEFAMHADTIAAPDSGVQELAKSIARRNKKECIMIEKRRPTHEEVEIVSLNGIVEGRKILLIDDIVSTGNTLISAAQFLEKKGARSISAAVTHGIFSNDAVTKIAKSPIQSFFVTNTIAHPPFLNSKIQTINIWPQLEKIIFAK